MFWSFIIIPIVLLLALRGLMWKGSLTKHKVLTSFTIFFFFAIFLEHYISSEFDLVYPNKTIERYKKAEQNVHASDKPVILYVGASHSYRGLIAHDIETELKKNDLYYTVVDLTIGGFGLLEQDYYIDKLLNDNATPEIVLLEISKRFEDPIREYLRPGIDDRMMPITDLNRTGWIFNYALETRRYTDIPHILYVSLVRNLGVGKFKIAASYDNISTSGQKFHHGIQKKLKKNSKLFSSEDIHIWSQKDLSKVKPQNIDPVILKWHKSFRSYQIKKLKKAGVQKVLFYAPPMISESYHAYMKSMCSFLGCIVMDDNDMNTILNGPFWYNETHLNKTGARIYSTWFGNVLANKLK